MDEKGLSDVDRLVQCFTRGVAQRRQNKRDILLQKASPTLYSSVRPNQCSPAAVLSSGDMKTPQGGMDTKGSTLNGLSHREIVSPGNARKQISPGVFYGSPFGKPSHKPLQVLRLLNEIQKDYLGQKYNRDALSQGGFKLVSTRRTAIWATFPKQEQAIQFAEINVNHGIAVFQYQDHINGQRRFLATTYSEFWERYVNMFPDHRHHYEIIQEAKPCHLYFDLEFNRGANTQADGEAMVDILLALLQIVLLEVYKLEYDPSWAVELDSSTKDKFSRHLIIRIPGAAFKDNTSVGLFVGEICRRIHQHQEYNEDLIRLFVLQGESLSSHKADIFIDQAVYSRNRSFRLPFSSKAGKIAKLLPSKRFGTSKMDDRDVFMNSLICRVDDECTRLLTFGEEHVGRGGTINYACWKQQPNQRRRPSCPSSGKSPFPALDIFIESVICIGGIEGRIRCWYWFSEYGVVVYNISENRYCENIGRPHKSNNVMYIVDFRTSCYYQKCHDPDCRGYRSALRPIPAHTIPPNFSISANPSCCKDDHVSLTRDQIQLFQEDSEDEMWWEEVAESLDTLESQTECLQASDKVSCTGRGETNEDGWWTSVLPELVALENACKKA